MDENFFHSINTKNIPIEFEPLGNSINKLVDRIHHFVKYQKELFIGTAHELKTPLAVIDSGLWVMKEKKEFDSHLISKMQSEILRANSLIETLRDLSNITVSSNKEEIDA